MRGVVNGRRESRRNAATVFVDFDNTLHRSNEKFASHLNGWMGRSGENILELYRRIHLKEIHANYPERHQDIDFHATLLLSYLRLPSDSTIKKDFVDRCLKASSDAWTGPSYYPDARRFLDELAKMGVKICLTTGEDAEKKAEGIYGFLWPHKFDYVFGEDGLGVLKTDREYFTRALRESRSEARSTISVGDSLTTDVIPAKLAGLKAMWINREGRHLPAGIEKPDFQALDLEEASRILWRIAAGLTSFK